MSYILQALQRAQSQRQAGQPVDLRVQTLVPAAGVVTAPTRRVPWTWVVVMLVLVAAGLTVAWLLARPMPAVSAAVATPAPVTPSVTASVVRPPSALMSSGAVIPTAVAPTAAPVALRVATPTSRVSASTTTPAMTDPVANLPTRAQLAATLREQLPPLVVNGVVYADDPAQRMLVLDNQVLQAGAQITSDLRLEYIGPRASVLSLRGTRFVLSH